ncbi:MAG: hypothetical protein ACKVH8_13065 [Pirellulales bacterium]
MSYLAIFFSLAAVCFYYDWSVQTSVLVAVGGLIFWGLLMNRKLMIPR